jgi:hypothetical protein
MEFTQYVPPAPLLTMAQIAEANLADLAAIPMPRLIRQVAVEDLPPPPPPPLVRCDRYAFMFEDIGDEDYQVWFLNNF